MLDGAGVKDNKNGKKKLFISGSLSPLAEGTYGPFIPGRADIACPVKCKACTQQPSITHPKVGWAVAAEHPLERKTKNKTNFFNVFKADTNIHFW